MSRPPLRCEDCGLLYRDFPLDLVLPDNEWLAIHPAGEGGVLCANCICGRARQLGVTVVHGRFEFAEGGWPPAHVR